MWRKDERKRRKVWVQHRNAERRMEVERSFSRRRAKGHEGLEEHKLITCLSGVVT